MKNRQKENRSAGTETVTNIITATTKMIGGFSMLVKGKSELADQARSLTDEDVRRYRKLVEIIVGGICFVLVVGTMCGIALLEVI